QTCALPSLPPSSRRRRSRARWPAPSLFPAVAGPSSTKCAPRAASLTHCLCRTSRASVPAMASHPDQDVPPRRTGLRIGAWVALVALLVLALGLVILWLNREEIADNFISAELAKRGIPASYEVESIGGRQQVLSNLVVGDPDHPDFTAERVEVFIRYGFGFPEVAEIRLLRPRLFGSYRDDQLSFGALDPLIFTGEESPFEFPDMRLRVVDGRGRLDSDHGAIGFKLAGSGHLRGGFAGELAAVAPELAGFGCEAR